ncbi:MAG: hypothetical protein ACYCZM_05560 [Acidimicrobiales bacterium]
MAQGVGGASTGRVGRAQPRRSVPTAQPSRGAGVAPPLRVLGNEALRANRRRRRARLLAVAAVAMTAFCLFGVVVAHVVITQNQFRLDHMTSNLSQAQAANEKLRLQVAMLEAPSRIVSTAEAHGMVRPPSITYLAPVPTPTTLTPAPRAPISASQTPTSGSTAAPSH